MDQLTGALASFLGLFAACFFRKEVFQTFRLMVGAWIVCLGKHTISRVWETTGHAPTEDHSRAFRLFSQAVWNFDEIARVLLVAVLTRFVPGTRLWLVVDDTLCHKRGAKVAYGGIFLDAVLSSKKRKTFRFGTNWVTLGLVVWFPFREDRPFCLNLLWRVCEKKTQKTAATHKTKPQLAREMIHLLAAWCPEKQILVVADVAYIGQALLKDRPENVDVIGPLRWDASLHQPWEEGCHKRRKKGDPLPKPRQMIEENSPCRSKPYLYESETELKVLMVKQVREVCWHHGAGETPVQLVFVRDSDGQWRDEVLLCTDPTLEAEEIIEGYFQRWSVEVAYAESKQWLGFHDPQVWCQNSVERATPMAWFVGVVVVLWYAIDGVRKDQVRRERPWYKNKPDPTFADMLATCRYDLWSEWLKPNSGSQAELNAKRDWILKYLSTAD
jgi:hypothetical protein